MSIDLTDQVHIITGAGRGIGLETARRIAQAGGRPIMIARSAEQVEQEAARLRDEGHAAEAHALDITDADGCKALVKQVRDDHGRIDGLVNNAGANLVANLLMCKESTWGPIFDVNVFALMRLTQLCLKPMVRAKYGRIVNISSIAAKLGAPYNTIYSASKAAVEGFTRSLALEVAKLGITVNAVAPAQVDTDLLRQGMSVRSKMAGKDTEEYIQTIVEANPQQRLLTPADIAGTIMHLLSPATAGVTGQSWNVCGGVAIGS